jgi:hypothetical protein
MPVLDLALDRVPAGVAVATRDIPRLPVSCSSSNSSYSAPKGDSVGLLSGRRSTVRPVGWPGTRTW